MAHYRETLRSEVVSRLTDIDGLSDPPHDSREKPILGASLPAVVVTLSTEAVADRSVSADGLDSERQLSIEIQACATSPSGLADLCEAIESRMSTPFSGAGDHQLQQTTFRDPVKGEREFFCAELEYQIVYWLLDTQPDRIRT